jgi:hypothetical protein
MGRDKYNVDKSYDWRILGEGPTPSRKFDLDKIRKLRARKAITPREFAKIRKMLKDG